MSQARRAAPHTPSMTMSEAERWPRSGSAEHPEHTQRIVTVDAVDGGWRVSAAHMEPLRFRSAGEAEKAGHRVAQNLTRLGLNARVDTYDEAGALTGAMPYPAKPAQRLTLRRQLDS